ncbi:hypothetical protein B0T26DRAFT_870692 [Lasiosphaeria miniovina]|uniref:CBM1 domain-containing protein n=1 Tax=Lasiosphaeria miniovina TaxID=1954250 RepID=A0AA40E4Z1_9PEZI|nr:uncharacterized protein B0T26DRAFT_870692 [Lasiosphaeria miniovina]KAK0722673.1 hypothetical protein B0T26DRAFT_870692 [Lasiosphaeria miniovina]
MAVLRTLVVALAVANTPTVLARLLEPDVFQISAFPACDPATSSGCIEGGKYLVPELDFGNEDGTGNNAYIKYLPNHTFTTTQWTNGQWPEICRNISVNSDNWSAADFTVYNVTFSDCSVPYALCRHKNAPKSLNQIEIARIPIGMRQAVATYIVYPDDTTNNPAYGGYIGTIAQSGVVVGKSTAYFATALVHETGHAVDTVLVGPMPGVSAFSGTQTWRAAVDSDGYAISAYGASSGYAEDFADVGRAVLLDTIFPGGLAAWSGNNQNLTQIAAQLALFKSTAGRYYVTGGTCDLAKKYPFPSRWVSLGAPPTTTTNPATATPYGQCGGFSTYTGPTACGPGYSCTSLNPFYSQCAPTPLP